MVWALPLSLLLRPQVRSLEAHMYPEKLKVIAQQVQLQQQQEQVRLLHQEKLEREQQHLRTQVSRWYPGGTLRVSLGASGRPAGQAQGLTLIKADIRGSQVSCILYYNESL